MKSRYAVVVSLLAAATLIGCAGQTTDPRQGGLFSYNPQAYDKRIQDRREHLSDVDQSTQAAGEQSSMLEAEKSSREKKNAALRKQLRKLSASVASLEKEIKSKQAKTNVQKKERQRMLTEINSIKSSSKLADEMDDPEEKRFELERLTKKREKLEKEAANLMLL
jgi:chromosome segregation ATPase